MFHRTSHSLPKTGAVPRRGGGGGLHSQSFVFHFYVLIHPLRFARPPVSEGQSAGAVIDFSFQFVTNSPPETGGVPRSGEGVDVFLFSDATHSVPTG